MSADLERSVEDNGRCKINHHTHTVNLQWTLENFMERKEKNGEKIESPMFEAFDSCGRSIKFKLWIYPKGEKKDKPNTVSLYLVPDEKTKPREKDIRTSIEFSILDGTNEIQNQMTITEHIFNRNENCGYGFPSYLGKDDLQNNPGWLKDGNLTIDTTFKVITDEDDITEDCQVELCNDLRKMFLEKELSDIKIICKDKTIDSHANILAARSPVFRAMFQSDMVERNERQVKIEGFNSKTVRQMLDFMYTGAFELADKKDKDKNTEDIEELLKAADQYLLESLKKICEKRLSNALDVGNCLQFLILADLHQADQLKKKAMEFVVENMTTIIKKTSDEWKRCLRNYPDLTVELMAEISEKMTKKM